MRIWDDTSSLFSLRNRACSEKNRARYKKARERAGSACIGINVQWTSVQKYHTNNLYTWIKSLVARIVDALVDLEIFFLWSMRGIARTVDALVDLEIFFLWLVWSIKVVYRKERRCFGWSWNFLLMIGMTHGRTVDALVDLEIFFLRSVWSIKGVYCKGRRCLDWSWNFLLMIGMIHLGIARNVGALIDLEIFFLWSIWSLKGIVWAVQNRALDNKPTVCNRLWQSND
jgi:hypothetical protein